jgi:hypothetical protein
MPSTSALELRRDGVRATFTADGVDLAWGRNTLPIAWSEIEMVSMTPSLVRGPDGWRPQYDHGAGLFAKHGVELSFVVYDRRVLLARLRGWWARVAMYSLFVAMVDADDRRMPDRALFRFQAEPARTAFPLEQLLDVIAAHCKLGLVVPF